jgi:probable HAF family extracellular repeat protein
MQGLGVLPGRPYSDAFDVSRDGSVIVGINYDPTGTLTEAFRWTPAGGMVGLGLLPGTTSSRAEAVSEDGSLVFGTTRTSTTDGPAFVWDAAHGMRNLQSVLANEHGLNLGGWRLSGVTDLSADNLTLVGNGINPGGYFEGFVIVLPEPAGVIALAAVSLASLLRKRR